MTKDQTLSLFRENDDPIRWEYPDGFDYPKAVSRFKAFVDDLKTSTGLSCKIETESAIQDASFHSQVDLGAGSLRFSNFGEMVAITPDHKVAGSILVAVQQLCPKHGYVLIPTEFTELPYTGVNPGVTGIRDWWIRYFDWI